MRKVELSAVTIKTPIPLDGGSDALENFSRSVMDRSKSCTRAVEVRGRSKSHVAMA